MAKVKCRCGNEVLFEPAPGMDTVKVLCHRCGSRIRVRLGSDFRSQEIPKGGDGFIRFFCPCGRRLKVAAKNPMPAHGRCPDCGRTVPVPATEIKKNADPSESPTCELTPQESEEFQAWREQFKA